MTEHEVLIVGAGPTGLTLAGELALAGVDVAVLERRPNHDLAGMRAGGLHARTLELLDQRGIAERFISQGTVYPTGLGFSMIPLHISDFPTRHNYVLGLWQNHIERILSEWVREAGVSINYGIEVAGFSQDDSGVNVSLSNGRTLRAHYLVGCDGGRSLIRKTAGIEFPGWDPTTSSLIAEVELAEEPPEWGIRRNAFGIHGLSKTETGKVRVMITEQHAGATGDPALRDLSEGLIAVYGTDYGVHSPASLTRFTDGTRQAASYRAGRVLLAGDAAHVHAPDGGQGAQLGIHDAVNLGWKLAQVVKGTSPESLLDTYQAERHPVTARALRNTMASVALRRDDERTKSLRETMTELLALDEPRRRLAGLLSGLDIHYDLGEGHPLLGRRMPDLDIVADGNKQRVYSLLHSARPVLINFRGRGSVVIDSWADRVQLVDATYDGVWDLPVLGIVSAPDAVLIRPDGYVAWVGVSTGDELDRALSKWFGAAG